MDIITLDFETYYDKQFSLRKLTTEEYIRHDQFEIIGLSVKVNGGDTSWLSGDHDALKDYLHANYDWANCAVLAHNTVLMVLFLVGYSTYILSCSLIRYVWGVLCMVQKWAGRLNS